MSPWEIGCPHSYLKLMRCPVALSKINLIGRNINVLGAVGCCNVRKGSLSFAQLLQREPRWVCSESCVPSELTILTDS
ncbi:hypothetical protein QLX08_004007 [Tetragonisca angustula]|uniref:Uncharacterized protein n=1 Tax=Tetragonisca angustula TaxID=166442 RepID=A0AAW1A4L4_9HYME